MKRNLDHSDKVRLKTRIKSDHSCKLIITCNRQNGNQHNKPVENWDILKFCQIRKNSKEKYNKKGY